MVKGYSYSIFNLVFETNVAALKIWDALGFKRLGRVKGAARLDKYTEKVDAIIYGRDLGEDDEYVSDERFDKIRFYLEKEKYPPGSNRSEKSRLRSAATHYRLEGERLMLKDKEVISDPQRQYEVSRNVHATSHGGINKTTAMIAEKYHWVQIKKTVSQVIRNCAECKEHPRAPVVNAQQNSGKVDTAMIDDEIDTRTSKSPPAPRPVPSPRSQRALPVPQPTPSKLSPPGQHHHQLAQAIQSQHEAMAGVGMSSTSAMPTNSIIPPNLIHDLDIPVDPAMMDDVQQQLQQQQQQHQQQQQQQQQHSLLQHHAHNIAPVPQMHGSLMGVSLDRDMISHHTNHHHSQSPTSLHVGSLGLHHQMHHPQVPHHLHHAHHVHDLMLDGDNSGRHGSIMSDSERDQFEQHDLQRLVAELKGYHDHDNDPDTL